MTNEQVYKLAEMQNELLSHRKSHKLQYCGQVIRQPKYTIECGQILMTDHDDRSCGIK